MLQEALREAAAAGLLLLPESGVDGFALIRGQVLIFDSEAPAAVAAGAIRKVLLRTIAPT